MDKFNRFITFLGNNKYRIVICVGVLIVAVIDDNSFIQRVRYELKINDLERQIEIYKSRHATDSKLLRELRNDPKTIERIARERYFMKSADEDIYVLSDEKKNLKESNEKTK